MFLFLGQLMVLRNHDQARRFTYPQMSKTSLAALSFCKIVQQNTGYNNAALIHFFF